MLAKLEDKDINRYTPYREVRRILLARSPAHSQVTSVNELVRLTYEWGERKKQFIPRQIELANTVLSEKGWIN